MRKQTKDLLQIGIGIAFVIFAIRSVITMPTDIFVALRYAGQAVGIALILLGFYEKVLWRFNPLEKTPKIFGAYTGTIEHNFNGESGKKDTSVVIKQSLLTVQVKIVTNETTSRTIASNIIEDNGEYVLFYTYITNPKSKYSDTNPIQYGSCRFELDNTGELHGIYWTSRTTKGDIYLKRSDK